MLAKKSVSSVLRRPASFLRKIYRFQDKPSKHASIYKLPIRSTHNLNHLKGMSVLYTATMEHSQLKKRQVLLSEHLCYSTQATVNDLSLKNPLVRGYLMKCCEEFKELWDKLQQPRSKGAQEMQNFHKRNIYLQPLATRMDNFLSLEADLVELDDMAADLEKDDNETLELITNDKSKISIEMEELESEIVSLMCPPEMADENDVILEVSHGTGGTEAMWFTKEILDMYEKYAAYKGWFVEDLLKDDVFEGGHGYKKASVLISGTNVYQHMKYESGVHRVQRTPKNSNRIQTSTMAVAILPQPTEIDIQLEEKDLDIKYSKAQGPGGQHVNKNDTCVTIKHIPTGIITSSQVTRSQNKNKETAMARLRSVLYEIEVDKQMASTQAARKIQVGSKGRSEKIRTYQFIQDRITDHRIGKHMFSIDMFMQGREQLDEMIEALQDESRDEQLMELLQNYKKQSAENT